MAIHLSSVNISIHIDLKITFYYANKSIQIDVSIEIHQFIRQNVLNYVLCSTVYRLALRNVKLIGSVVSIKIHAKRVVFTDDIHTACVT